MPVAHLLQAARIQVQLEVVTVFEAIDGGEDGPWRGNVAMRQVRVDAFGRKPPPGFWQERQYRAHGGTESKLTIETRINQRLQSHAVAHQPGDAFAKIEDGEGKHAAQ